jgi:hypothetical protein
LTGFETAIGFVDDIGASTAANHTVIAVTVLEGLERVDNFHDENLY